MQIVKISGKPGSGKTELLSIIAAGSRGSYAAVSGRHSADDIVRALRGRRDCVLTVDECSPKLLEELERHPELTSGARVVRIYAVVDELRVIQPEEPPKRVRITPPRLDDLKLEEAVTAALAKRDREWTQAIQAAGGGVA